MSSPLSVRVSKASEVLGVSADQIIKVLQEEGITDSAAGLAILDAPSTEIMDLVSILVTVDTSLSGKLLKLKAAATILKDSGCERPKTAQVEAAPTSLVDALKTMRPIQQWSDQELLEKFAKDRDGDIESELHQRSKGRHFIVLKQGKTEPGKEEIDIEKSMDILKTARKRETSSMLPYGDKVVPVYRITELNIDDRIIELCPICGETLFKGYCEKCQVTFAGVGDDERAFIKLISETETFNAFGRKDLIASALKGIDDLKNTWPGLTQKFDELKATNSLPKLRQIMNRPTVMDPFFTDGNRVFGHKTF